MNWFVLRTQVRRELAVERVIQERLGLGVYCPKVTTKRRHPFDRRQTIKVQRAIYYGYLFSPEHFPIEYVTTTKLSAHWLMHCGTLAKISNRLIDLAEHGERFGTAVEEVLEALRASPLAKRMAKRAPYTKDIKSVLGRAA